MFSRQEKMNIARAVEEVLIKINHPEMPKQRPNFSLHVEGAESWSWADILPNWHYSKQTPQTTNWNESARDYMEGANNGT